MTILSGVGFLAMALLVFGWAYGAMRRPDPKPWADSEAFATGIVLVLTALVCATLGLMAQAAFTVEASLAEAGAAGLAVGAGVLVGALLVSRLLMAPARRKSVSATGPVTGLPELPLSAANDNAAIGSRAA